jgi:hypothetical protein
MRMQTFVGDSDSGSSLDWWVAPPERRVAVGEGGGGGIGAMRRRKEERDGALEVVQWGKEEGDGVPKAAEAVRLGRSRSRDRKGQGLRLFGFLSKVAKVYHIYG